MISFHVEPWQDFKREALHLWGEHWKEIALDKDVIKLDVDYEQYERLDLDGALHVVVARAAGAIVGYHLSILRPHLHYRTSFTAFTDVYYVAPKYRKGMTGVKLFKFVEQTLRARGVQKMYSATKLHTSDDGRDLNVGKLFERMGWKEIERVYAKVLR